MRVLYFHQHFTTPDGSGGTRSFEFACALVARGHRVTMVCGANRQSGLDLPFDSTRKWSRGTLGGIDVIALPLPYSNRDGLFKRTSVFLRFAWRSAWLAMTEDYDVLFATSTPLTAGIPGIVMRLTGRGRPFVFEVRDLWPELPRALGVRNPFVLGGMSILEWMSYRTSTACIGLSPGIVEGIRRRSRPGHSVAMIPNGCDLELFHPAKRAALKLPGVEPSDFVAGFTGAHGKANGLDAVLDAAAELLRRNRVDIKIVLIGDGNQKDRLMDRAKAEGLDNVLFFPPVKKTDIARITASFDCGLMILANVPAFYFGTSPNKFFDYISAGVPVINNYPGWLANILVEHECGIAVPPGNAGLLADAICRMADAPRERSEMGKRARALAVNEFGRSALAERFISVLEQSSRN